jgi:hypothetical protein
LAVADDGRSMTEWLDSMGIQCKVVEVWNLRGTISHCTRLFCGTHVLQEPDLFRVLIGYVLLDERSRFEQFLTSLTPELSFILLLDERLGVLCQLATNESLRCDAW